MKVLIIPEDQELDRYVIQPVIEALFNDLGRPARIEVLPEPRLRGAGEALSKETIRSIVEDNRMIDLFLLVVDRDCDRKGHEAKAAEREKEHPGKLLACLACQEVEAWMMALHKGQLSAPWPEVRAHCDSKEEYAEPLLQKLGTGGPGRGRKAAMRALQGSWRSLRDSCPELRALQERIEAWKAG